MDKDQLIKLIEKMKIQKFVLGKTIKNSLCSR